MELKVKVAKSNKLKGIRCIIADSKIKKGELIEECPIILLTKKDIEHINETTLTKYEFMWDDEYEAIALGYGSLYNHSEEPNVEWDRDFEKNVFVFTALKDIEPGEELTIDYFPGEPKEDFPEEYLDFMH